jgi:hypothetical protein
MRTGQWSMYAGDLRVNTHVVIVVTPDVVRQLMAQHSPNLPVTPEPVVPVGTDAELDGLPLVDVQTQQPWVLMRSKFCQQSNRELVRIHHMEDRLIVR